MAKDMYIWMAYLDFINLIKVDLLVSLMRKIIKMYWNYTAII